MASWIAIILAVGAVLYLYARWGDDFPRFSRRLLPATAFFPVIGILNHNLDGRSLVEYTGPADIVGPLLVMSPVYLAATLGFFSFARSKRTADLTVGVWPIGLIGLYAALCLAGLPWSYDGVWSLTALLWSLPMFALACLAGLSTDLDELSRESGFVLALFGLVGINLGLVVLGLSSGRAESLMGARNFGSVYASNSMIAMVVLMGPFAYLQAKRSWWLTSGFFFALVLVAVMSLSRSALFVAMMLAALIAWSVWLGEGKLIAKATAGLVPVVLVAGFALSGFLAESRLGEVWVSRFFDPDSGVSRLEGAFEKRSEIFVDDLIGALETPWVGRGFGSIGDTSTAGFTDLHNLTYTELYENGGLAVAALLAVVVLAVLVGAVSPSQRRVLPLTAALVVWIVLAHTTGSTLALRSPGGYTTPIHGTLVFLLVGAVFREGSRSFARQAVAAT